MKYEERSEKVLVRDSMEDTRSSQSLPSALTENLGMSAKLFSRKVT